MAKDIAKYHSQFVRDHLRQFMFKVNRDKEPDMVEWLESQENVQAYIRNLIRQDMEKNKPGT